MKSLASLKVLCIVGNNIETNSVSNDSKKSVSFLKLLDIAKAFLTLDIISDLPSLPMPISFLNVDSLCTLSLFSFLVLRVARTQEKKRWKEMKGK